MDSRLVIWSGFLQGVGTGFAYVPLAAVSFATLAPHLRFEGTAIFNLLRNIGSSIGIATMQTLLVRNTQIMHARLAEHVVPYGTALKGSGYDVATSHGLAALNASVTRQASMIAYNNDFKLLLVMTLAVMPLLLMLRAGRRQGSAAPVVAE
jgi:DHA2 family multidrug resistance protein